MEIKAYTVPFTHWVIDGFLEQQIAMPDVYWPHWVQYANDNEHRKRTCNNITHLTGTGAEKAIEYLQDSDTLSFFSELSGIPLSIDPTLHGAGLHVTDPGGYLSPHIDYSLHPKFPNFERRLNAVLFCNNGWCEAWGGALEFYNDDATKVVTRIYPYPQRLVAWLPSDTAFHGVQVISSLNTPRVTVAVNYLSPARSEATRKRALFVPHRK